MILIHMAVTKQDMEIILTNSTLVTMLIHQGVLNLLIKLAAIMLRVEMVVVNK
jgi:hypothetical protein